MRRRKFGAGGDVEYSDYGDSEPSSITVKPQSFKEAFRSARSGGAKTFEWRGKKYTTELAPSSKPAPAVPGRPRGESVGAPARKAPMFARDKDFDKNVVAAAIRNREAKAELDRESRRGGMKKGGKVPGKKC